MNTKTEVQGYIYKVATSHRNWFEQLLIIFSVVSQPNHCCLLVDLLIHYFIHLFVEVLFQLVEFIKLTQTLSPRVCLMLLHKHCLERSQGLVNQGTGFVIKLRVWIQQWSLVVLGIASTLNMLLCYTMKPWSVSSFVGYPSGTPIREKQYGVPSRE